MATYTDFGSSERMRYQLVETYNISGKTLTTVSMVTREAYQERLAKAGIDIDVGGVWHYEEGGVSLHIEHWPNEWVWSPLKEAYVRPADSFC